MDLTGLSNPEILIEAIKTITNNDLAIFTDSNLIMTNVPGVLDMVLTQSGLKDVVTIPAGIDWNSELMRIVDVLNTEAFNLVAYKDGKFDLTGINNLGTIIEAVKTITSDDLAIFTDSKLIMSNIDSVLGMALAQSGLEGLVTIPAGTDWNSELMRIVNVLHTEAVNTLLYNAAGELTFEGIKNLEVIINAVKTITSDDLAILTDSKLVMSNIDMVLDMALTQSGLKELVTIPAGTDWNSELMNIANVLNTAAFNTLLYKDGKMDFTRVSNPEILIEAIKTITNNDLAIFTDSNLVMTNVPAVLDMVLTQAGLKDVVTIPAGTDWNSELMRIVDVLNTEAFN